MRIVFLILADLAGIYSVTCLLRIILSYFWQTSQSKATNFLAAICDPYLSLFDTAAADNATFNFSNVIALIILVIIQNIFLSLSNIQQFNVGTVLLALVDVVLSIISGLATFVIIIVIVRFIMEILGYQNIFTDSVDRTLEPLFRLVTNIVKNTDMKVLCTISVAVLILLKVLIKFLQWIL